MPGFPSTTHTLPDAIEQHALASPLACPTTPAHQRALPVVPHTDLPPASAAGDAARENPQNTTAPRGAEEAEEQQQQQRDTPLRRRFLREVGGAGGVVMVGVETESGGGGGDDDGRGTPVSRRGTPTKRREARGGGRVTPMGGRASPRNEVLEVGVGRFYFSCEIPVWKVVSGTPTKTGLFVKGRMEEEGDLRGASPMRRRLFDAQAGKKANDVPTLGKKVTPKRSHARSDIKNIPDQGAMGSPRKPLPDSPLRTMSTPRSSRRQPRDGQSPTKARETPTRGAIHSVGGKLSLEQSPISLVDMENKENTTTTTQCPAINPLTGDQANTNKRQSNISGPYDIGGLMARLKSAPTSRTSTSKGGEAETGTSAPPTPLRKAAESIQVTPVSAVVKKNTGAGVMQKQVVSMKMGDGEKESSEPEPGLPASISVSLPMNNNSVKNSSSSPTAAHAVPARSVTFEGELGSQVMSPESIEKHVHFPSASQLAETVGKSSKLSMMESNGTEKWVFGAMQRELNQIQGSMKKAGFGQPKNVTPMEHGTEEQSQHIEKQQDMHTPTPAQRLRKIGTGKAKAPDQSFGKTTKVVPSSPSAVTKSPAPVPSVRKSPSGSPTISNNPNAPRSINAPKPKVPAYARPTQASRASTAQPKGATYPKNSPARKGAPGKATGHSRTTSKPQLERVVSAVEISERVKKWHAEEESAGDTPTASHDAAAPAPTAPQSQPQAPQTSHTPPGSPPTAGAKGHHHARRPRPHPTAWKGAAGTDGVPSPPKTHPLQPRFPRARNAHTPMKSRIPAYDRNAFRPPSKEIEGSLSAAIDLKIRQDRVGGLEG